MMRFALILTCCLVIAGSAIAQEKLPVPDKTAREKARKLILEIYGDEIDRATTAEAKAAVGAKLLDEAKNLKEPAGKFALIRTALDHAPDVKTALRAVDEMAKSFEIDVVTAKATAVWMVSKKAKSATEQNDVATAALQVADEAERESEFDVALKLGGIAESAALQAKDFKLVREIRKRTLDIKKRQADFEDARKALALLDNDPTNAAANTIAGKYWCLTRGDWEQGLPMLALGDDAGLNAVAIRDLKQPESSSDQVDLADAWFQLAEAADESARDALKQRAAYWYRAALKSQPMLTGLIRAKVEKRLNEIGPRGAGQPNKVEAPAAGRSLSDRYVKTELRHTIAAHDGVISTVAFSPDGKLIMSASKGRLEANVYRGDKTIRLWDPRTGRPVGPIAQSGSSLRAAAWTPDGRHVISGDGGGKARVWDMQSGKAVAEFKVQSGAIEGIAVSPDGSLIATAATDGSIALWRTATRQQITVVPAHTDRAYFVCFSPRGDLVASASRDGTVKIIEVKSGKILHNLTGHTNVVLGVAFSPEGQTLASTGSDDTIRLWNVKTGQQQRVLSGHTDNVHCLAYSADGSMLASAGRDRTIRLWDANGLRDTLQGHTDQIQSVAFSPGGSMLASADSAGKILAWEIETKSAR